MISLLSFRWFLQQLLFFIQSWFFNYSNLDLDGETVSDFEHILIKSLIKENISQKGLISVRIVGRLVIMLNVIIKYLKTILIIKKYT